MGAQQTKEKAAGADLTTKAAPHLAAAAKTGGSAADAADADDSPKKRAERQKKAGLSDRGLRNLYDMEALLAMFFGKRSNVWSPENPEGSIPMAIADNQLMRPELIEFYNSPGKLALKPQDLTYADRGMCSKRLLDAICGMVNTTPDGFFFEDDKKDQWPKPIKEIKIEHIVVGNGATGVLDALFWALINDGDGILLSQPHYNAFSNDTTLRDKAELILVQPPIPVASAKEPKEPREHVAPDTVKYYADALKNAEKKGTKVKCILLCNPHNPSGAIYPRETVVALAKFAAEHDLHLVMDEIYSRSVFRTNDVPDPTPFYSILGIDVEKEAGLNPSRVHVVSSASKDFSTNGFRLGYVISQHNPDLCLTLLGSALMSQAAAPSANLFAALLEDKEYLGRYMAENRRRIAASYNYLTAFFRKHQLPYVPSNSGFFLLVDLRQYLDVKPGTDEKKARESEMRLLDRLQDGKVTLAPGTIYKHPIPGFYRLTYTLVPEALKLGLSRMEDIFGWEKWIDEQPLPWTRT